MTFVGSGPGDLGLLTMNGSRALQVADLVIIDEDADYLDALERAPRHPELARRIAEIDHAVGGRAEAALSLLREATAHAGDERVLVGALKAELLVEHGDVPGAIATLLAEAEREPDDALGAA